MEKARPSTGKQKAKSDWQLFTNDGRFDSKIPPYQRLLRKKSGYKVIVLPRTKSATPKLAASQSEKPQPQVDNIENFVVVWLDHSMDGKPRSNQQSKHQLQQVVNSVKIFMDIKECQAFMSKIKDEKIFVIVSGIVEEDFVSSIHDEKQLESIYVYSPDKVKEESWFSQYPEIRGIYTTLLSLCEQLDKDVKRLDRILLGFEVMERSSSKDASDASEQEASFMYDQLFRDIILAVLDENMEDMYEFCEKQYRGNVKEQSSLKKLKTTYTPESAIWWYTQDTFLYRMLNKAFRTHDYDTLYLLRVYIRHLHEQIAEEQAKSSISEMKLYRGQGMEKDDFERIRTNKGGLLSISSFLSTSSDRDVGLKFAREALGDRRKESVLMEITVEKNTIVPVANVTEMSEFKLEKEWLLSMGSVFRVGALKRSHEGIWVIPLTLTDDHDRRLTALKEHFKKSMVDSNVCLNLAKLMHQLAAWKKSEYFYRMALETETSPQRRSVLYNNLAMVKGEMEQYDAALVYYNKSLALKETGESDSESNKATTYNNIATIYWKQKKIDKAIEYFQKALEACNTQGDNDEELIATLHANIAGILNEQGKHQEALEKCQEALTIEMKIFPEFHPSIATTYGTIANTMYRMRLYGKAIEYAKKAVHIDQRSLLKTHPQSVSHMNDLQVYEQQQSDMNANQ